MTRSTLYQFSCEPAVFLYTFAIWIYSALIQELILQKTCSPLEEPESIIHYICNDTNLLANAADLQSLKSTLSETLPALALLLAGCRRDSTGLNKPMMYISLAGQIVGVSLEVFSSWDWAVPAWKTTLADTLINGVFGGRKLFYLGAACVVIDLSKPKDRTARLTLNLGAAVAGACLATGFSHQILKYFGYWKSFLLVEALLMTSAVLVAYILEDGTKKIKCKRWDVYQRLTSVFKPRPNNKAIWLMVICCALISVSNAAEKKVFRYYLQEGFNFTTKQAGYYLTYQQMIYVASSIALPRLLSKFLKRSNLNIAIVSAIIAVVSATAMAFARSKIELLSIALLGFMNCFLITIPKSVITTSVNDHEIGIYLSLCYIGGCILPIGFFPLYDKIFAAAVEIMPGAFYLISAGIATILIIFYGVALSIYVYPDNDSEQNYTEDTNEDLVNCVSCQEQKTKF